MANWDKYNDALKKKVDNKCHSSNRFTCYQTDEKTDTNFRHFKHLTVEGHLYSAADTCVEQLLGATFIQFSIIGLLAILAILL